MVEGFRSSENMHGIRFLKFIADGDASTYARLKERVPYGRRIQKIECKNHMLKNITKALYKLKNDTTVDINGRKFLTTNKIKLFEELLQKTIYENSTTADLNSLCEDIKNVVYHIYEDHTSCKEYYCNSVGETANSKIPQLKATAMFSHIEGKKCLMHASKL